MTVSTALATIPTADAFDAADNDQARVQLIRAAIELDVATVVASGCRDLDAIAQAIGCPARSSEVLLDGLCALGLLAWHDGRYELTPVSERYLVPGSPAYLAPAVLASLRAEDRFVENLRRGRTETDVASELEASFWAAWARAELAGWPDGTEIYRQRWQALGITPAPAGGLNVLDVGCGSAIASLTLAHDDPATTVTCLDRSEVLVATAETAAALDVTDRVRLIPGNTTTLRDLDGPFDVVFFGHVLHFLEPDAIVGALRDARRLLAAGGRVVILEMIRTVGDYTNARFHLASVWLFNVAPGGRFYTFDELATMLTSAGFEPPVQLEGAPWLQARVGR